MIVKKIIHACSNQIPVPSFTFNLLLLFGRRRDLNAEEGWTHSSTVGVEMIEERREIDYISGGENLENACK